MTTATTQCGAGVPDFIKKLLNHTHFYESPTSFWKWSAYTAIAATLRDNVWLPQGDHKLYPNMYTLLVADSAVHRKGNPVRFCESLTTKTKATKVISGRSSIQAILDELSRGETDTKTGAILKGGSCLFSAPELSAGIVNDPEAVKILTDIYDFKEEYTSRLRGSGTFRIKNVCFTMMAASNEDLLRDVYDSKAIFGGLLGRTFLVKPSEFREGNSLFDVVDTSESLKNLENMLKDIAVGVIGEMTISAPAKLEYESWYHPFRKGYKNKPDKSGIMGRIHTSVLKLAIVLTANTLEREINRQIMEEAIEECVGLLPNYQSFVMSGGKSTIAEVGSILFQELYEAEGHTLDRREILRKHWSDFDAEVFDKTLQTLIPAGMISESMSSGGVSYTLTKKCIETLFKENK